LSSTDIVYFIQGVVLKHVKIGYSTRSALINRLKNHQTGSPDRLQLLGVILGGRKFEAELHRKFNNVRLHGEWFEYSKELENFIKENSLLLNKQAILNMCPTAICESTMALDKYISSPEEASTLNKLDLTEWYIEELFGTFERLLAKNS